MTSLIQPTDRLGVDVGRVIMCPADSDGRPDTSFLDASDEAALDVPPSPWLMETLPALVRLFGARVFIVSKAGKRIERLTRLWFEHRGFCELTGIAPEHLHFCRRRNEKRAHADALGLTHFIDDRLDVLSFLRGGVPNLFLFGAQAQPIPDWVTHVADWRAVGATFGLEPQGSMNSGGTRAVSHTPFGAR
jgi:hypothetical protein